ncbi:MAG: hypothetical protein H6573_15255 [Lewinellaceae bacterium]|nr:hypothetical protein [Phaeodactylibacter sp.]MCB9348845.1 hypothetical protein [Lewinellaceae bacterium]
MYIVSILVYAIFCLLVAWAGRYSVMGFFGVLVLSIFVTPLLTAILFVLFQQQRRRK